jgi:adenine-specific DNA-methyltransferase
MRESFQIQNRKYLGSKHRLLTFIREVILSLAAPIGVFIDGFAGTGIVAYHFRSYADKIIANDLLHSNYVANRAFLTSTRENTDLKRISRLIQSLNRLDPVSGYVYAHYGGTYFSGENAARIDAIRQEIERQTQGGSISSHERCLLLTSLIYAVDKVANTVGQYDAFLKHLGKEAYDEGGRHRVDASVYKLLTLRVPSLALDGDAEVYREDITGLVRRLEGDVLYLDPPYNGRQYVDCYHVLENIVTWQKPELKGKTKKFERSHLKSAFSMKSRAAAAFEELIREARVRHIFVSYNSEGILPDQRITEALEARGELTRFTKSYPVFGHGAGRSAKREVEERIFHCKVREGS